MAGWGGGGAGGGGPTDSYLKGWGFNHGLVYFSLSTSDLPTHLGEVGQPALHRVYLSSLFSLQILPWGGWALDLFQLGHPFSLTQGRP